MGPMHLEDFYEMAGIPILVGYGLTETSPVIASRQGPRVQIIGYTDILPPWRPEKYSAHSRWARKVGVARIHQSAPHFLIFRA